MGVLVLYLIAGAAALLLIILFAPCRIRAKLWLEIAGGHMELHVSHLLPIKRFRFRLHLLSEPFLTIDWLRNDGHVQTIYRAFEKKKSANPWAAAVWEASNWRRVRAYLEVGEDTEPALSVFAYGALYQFLLYLLRKHLTPKAQVAGSPNAYGALFRLNVEGMATLSPAQIIIKQYQKKRRK